MPVWVMTLQPKTPVILVGKHLEQYFEGLSAFVNGGVLSEVLISSPVGTSQRKVLYTDLLFSAVSHPHLFLLVWWFWKTLPIIQRSFQPGFLANCKHPFCPDRLASRIPYRPNKALLLVTMRAKSLWLLTSLCNNKRITNFQYNI